LAKAAIALANHGGGTIVLGMQENAAEGGNLVSLARPEELARYSQDLVISAINRFADPELHCELHFAVHPTSQVEHAFVVIPSGTTTPVMSKRGCDGVIEQNRCYIRKPGPRSEEPRTSAEWRALLDRCVKAGRQEMLDAIRLIVQGQSLATGDDEDGGDFQAFVVDARARWNELVGPLPVDDPARMPHGHKEFSFEFEDVAAAGSLNAVRERMNQANTVRLTGWGPFVTLERPEFQPRAIGNVVEAWLGNPEGERAGRDAAHCDFWRVDPRGKLFVVRGYTEDAWGGLEPGTSLDLTSPIWNVGEAILYVARFARHFAENPTIRVQCTYTGLQGRVLKSIDGMRLLHDDRVCADERVELTTVAMAEEIDVNLPEILQPMLAPLYERFEFFEPPRDMITQELAKLRRNRF